MIEVTNTYDLQPGANLEAYAEWAKKAAAMIVQQAGLVELRAHRNMLGTPQIRTTSCWNSTSDWAAFADGPWRTLEQELRTFATNLKVEMWGPSPVLPTPLRPDPTGGAGA
ncbi:antibiotic biosynthesis monooxygenase [Paraburkholderia sp. A3BS-1L]|uniref:antibiotic biosynthesis monooxygenase family protein n=1 Tax=Paraburkholderia sp. A3BS-1L TaxID=3028375 RepID=UPI003DA80E1B